MALTFQTAAGGFVTPDLGASPFPDDLTPPESSHALSPPAADGENGWYTGPVEVSLEAADEAGGSDVERTDYRIDGGAFQPYTEPFTVTGDGRHQVEYRSVDRAGNTESPELVEVKVDGTAPATVAALDPERPAASGWYDQPVELTLSGRDGNGSGTGQIEYQVGGGAWQPYTEPLVFEEPGSYVVGYRATDVAGNTSTPQTCQNLS